MPTYFFQQFPTRFAKHSSNLVLYGFVVHVYRNVYILTAYLDTPLTASAVLEDESTGLKSEDAVPQVKADAE